MFNKIKDNIKFTHIDDKRLLLNVFISLLIKGLTLIFSFVSTPLYIRFFNDDMVLGVWFTLLSLLTMTLNFDFGIGNGLRNKLVYS